MTATRFETSPALEMGGRAGGSLSAVRPGPATAATPAPATTAGAGAPRRRNKSKEKGTAAETAVVKVLRANGFPHAERRTLKGIHDQGDITGCIGLCFEVKGGDAAKDASDNQIAAWMAETETERVNAGADIGILVLQRRGIGPANAGRWWAILPAAWVARLMLGDFQILPDQCFPVRMHLADVCTLLRRAGYGTPLDAEAVTA